mmetsp:Transcript_22047/g.55884  ORF Transcript_22047/g.55884 Transcript_22047/m.55884 type:complete len:233 (+) Transcript_22047:5920-6618(+)
MFLVPRVHQRDVHRAPCPPGALAERLGRPEERERARRQLRVQRQLLEQRCDHLRQFEVEPVSEIIALPLPLRTIARTPLRRNLRLLRRSGDRVDNRVVVESRQVWVITLDEAAGGVVVEGHVHVARSAVEEVREGDAVLRAHGLPDDDLVDVIELVPVVVVRIQVAVERLELGASGNGHVQRLCREERAHVEEIVVVLVGHICEKLRSQTVQRAHHGQRKLPRAVARPVDEL